MSRILGGLGALLLSTTTFATQPDPLVCRRIAGEPVTFENLPFLVAFANSTEISVVTKGHFQLRVRVFCDENSKLNPQVSAFIKSAVFPGRLTFALSVFPGGVQGFLQSEGKFEMKVLLAIILAGSHYDRRRPENSAVPMYLVNEYLREARYAASILVRQFRNGTFNPSTAVRYLPFLLEAEGVLKVDGYIQNSAGYRKNMEVLKTLLGWKPT